MVKKVLLLIRSGVEIIANFTYAKLPKFKFIFSILYNILDIPIFSIFSIRKAYNFNNQYIEALK